MKVFKTPRRSCLPLLLLLTPFTPLSQAVADTATNREVARFAAGVQVERGDYDQAASVLEAHVAEDPQDGAAWRMLALIQERRGRIAESRAALNRALAMAGAAERQSLETLLTPTSTSSTASDPRSPDPRPWRLVATLDAGYDSNVILLNDATRSGSTDSGESSPYSSPSLRGGWNWNDRERESKLEASTAFTSYTKATARTFNSLYSTATFETRERNRGRWSQGFGVDLDTSFLNSNGFGFFNWGAFPTWTPQWKHPGGSLTTFRWAAGYRKFHTETGDALSSDRSGPALAGKIEQSMTGAGGILVRLGGSYEHQSTRGEDYKSDTFAGWLDVSRPIARNWSVSGRLGPGATFYPNSSQGRSDRSLDADAALSWKTTPALAINLSWVLRRNTSTQLDARYSKQQTGLGLSYAL